MTTLTLDRTGETTPDSPETHPNPNRAQERAERARINGAKSRGPVTAEGKARSSQNARKHGFTAKIFLVDPADEDEYNEFEQGFLNSLSPTNEVERLLVESIVQISWKLRQADNIEMDLLRDNLEKGHTLHSAFTYDSKSLMAVSTYQSRLDRRFHKLFDQLRKLRKDAKRTQPAKTPLQAAVDAILSTPLEDIQREKQRRGITSQIDQTNPEFEPDSGKTNPDTTRDLSAKPQEEPRRASCRESSPGRQPVPTLRLHAEQRPLPATARFGPNEDPAGRNPRKPRPQAA